MFHLEAISQLWPKYFSWNTKWDTRLCGCGLCFYSQYSGGRGRWISKFWASLVHRVSFRIAEVRQRNPVLKNQRRRKEKRKYQNLNNSGLAWTTYWNYFSVNQNHPVSLKNLGFLSSVLPSYAASQYLSWPWGVKFPPDSAGEEVGIGYWPKLWGGYWLLCPWMPPWQDIWSYTHLQPPLVLDTQHRGVFTLCPVIACSSGFLAGVLKELSFSWPSLPSVLTRVISF